MALAADLRAKVEGCTGVDAEGEGFGQRGVVLVKLPKLSPNFFVDFRGPRLERS